MKIIYHFCAVVNLGDSAPYIDGLLSMEKPIITMEEYAIAKTLICGIDPSLKNREKVCTIQSLTKLEEVSE